MSSETDFQNLRNLIFFMLLGDGSICKTEEHHNNCLEITHSIAQKDYLFYKMNLLSEYGISIGKPYYRRDKMECRIRTERNEIFTIMRKRCYDTNGKKYLSKRMLKNLNPLGLSLWYMDDGSAKIIHPSWRKNIYSIEGRNSTKISQIKLSVCGFDDESNNNAIDILNKNFGLSFDLYLERSKKQNKSYPVLCVSGKTQIDLFIEIVRPHIIPSMEYKINHPTTFYNFSLEETERNDNS